MSSKNKFGKFKKKDFIRIILSTRTYLCDKFGYKIKPHIFETRLPKGCLMMFIHQQNTYVIFYDYIKFKKVFGSLDFDAQEAYAAAVMAHEMRHYYQHRQMIAAKPKEKEEIIVRWRENEQEPVEMEGDELCLEHFLQPLELDASLFEYVFGAEVFDLALLQVIYSQEHYDAMEQLYIEYFGETDAKFFNEEIRRILKDRQGETRANKERGEMQ
jgi:hypothetical protein